MKKIIQFIAITFLTLNYLVVNAQSATSYGLYNNSTISKSIDLSKPVGTIEGKVGTSPNGAATYSIPIKCPPGTNGLVPKISISYNSQGGSGLVGLGWNLSGTSSISRSVKDHFHDGEVKKIDYSSQTPFTLDGTRLFTISGINGDDGTTYRPECENYSVTTSYGKTSGGSPLYFKVLNKDGSFVEYGNSSDSKLMSEDNTNVIIWMVSKIQDVNGNYILFEYETYYQDLRIKRIKYTGNISGLLPYNEIVFKYADDNRVDRNTFYVSGDEIRNWKILKEIEIKEIGGDIFKKYQMNYGHDFQFSYLTSIEEIASDGTKLNDTRFKYGDIPVSSFEVEESSLALDVDNDKIAVGDYNGDGKDDILKVSKGSTDLVDMSMYFNGPSYTLGKSMTGLANLKEFGSASSYKYSGTVPSDFDGDGKDEVLCINYVNDIVYWDAMPMWNRSYFVDTKIYTPDNSSSLLPTKTIAPPPSPNNLAGFKPFLIGDFDGDKRTDYFTIGRRYCCPGYIFWAAYHIFSVHINFPGRTESNIPLVLESTGGLDEDWAKKIHNYPITQVMDFDGDGKSEIFGLKDKDYFVINFKKLASGNYAVNVVLEGTFTATENPELLGIGDFNGDGKSDLLCKFISGGNYKILYSTGKSFKIEPFIFYNDYNKEIDLTSPTGSTTTVEGDLIHIGDFNGDGKSDILHQKRPAIYSSYYNTTIFDLYEDGGFYKSYNYSGFVSPKIQPVVGDMNGDGKADLSFVKEVSSVNKLHTLYFNKNSKQYLLEKINDGYGRNTEISYKQLTDTHLSSGEEYFKKGSYSSYPLNSPQYAIYVVTSIKSDNGIGGTNTVDYRYENLIAHRAGRGLIGFQKIKTIDYNSDTRTEDNYTYYSPTASPFLQLTKTYQHSTGVQLSESSNGYFFSSYSTTPGGPFKMQLISTTSQDLLKGVTTSTDYGYDSYGNTTSTSTTTTGGSITLTTTTATTYVATAGSSIPNRPSEIITTNKRGSQPTVSIKNILNYYPNGSVKESITYPTTSSVNVVKNYFEYDVYGNVLLTRKSTLATFSPHTPTAKYEYDSKGRFVISEENAIGDKKYTTSHKFWGKPLSVTDFNGLTTTNTYDNWGKLTSTTVPTSTSSNYTISYTDGWDISGNQLYYTLSQDPSSPDVKTWYDKFGRPIKTKKESFASAWTEALTTYDARGNVATSTNNYLATETPITTTSTYDAFNRLLSSSNVFGTTSYSYTLGSGEATTTQTLPDGKVKKSTIDATGKLIKSSNGIAGTVHYTYDSWGNETVLGVGHFGTAFFTMISKEYDVSGRLKKETDQDAGTTTYTYNTYGQLLSKIDPKGKVTSFQYDLVGRISQKSLDGYVTTYNYYGNLKNYALQKATVISPTDGTIEDFYDYAIGGGITKHIKTTNGVAIEKQYTYDGYNNLLTTNYINSTFKTKNHYDANGFLQKITTDISGTPATEKVLYEASAMNGNGQITNFKRVDGLSATNAYYNGVPTSYVTSGIQDLSMSYNYANGNMMSRLDNITQTKEDFTYDALDRLTKAEAQKLGAMGVVHIPLNMTYDAVGIGYSLGKLTSKSDVGSYAYSGFPQNAVKSILVGSSTVISHETQDIVYNPFNKAQKITEKIGANYYEEKFVYDANDDRSYTQQSQGAITPSSIVRKRWYMGDFEIDQKYTGAAKTHKLHYITSDAGLVGIVVEESGNFNYYAVYTDHLGSIVTLTNDAGTVIAKQNYDPWGRERNPDTWGYAASFTSGGTTPTPPEWLYRGYTGHEMLPEYGLINMNGRMYDPANGRMLRPDNCVQDPSNSQSYNRYSYCLNNPLKYLDPSGNQFEGANNSYGGYQGSYYGIPYSVSYLSYMNSFSYSFPSFFNNGVSTTTYMNNVSEFNWGFSASITAPNFSSSFSVNYSNFSISSIPTSTQLNPEYSHFLNTMSSIGESSSKGSGWAGAALGFIATDAAVPDPTDAAWPKWAGYGVVGAVAYNVAHPNAIQDDMVSLLSTSVQLLAKMNREIEGIRQRMAGPQGFQYALVANYSGNYPVMVSGSSLPMGSKYLNAGDVWKYGETTSSDRYTNDYLNGIGKGVTQIPQYYGSQIQIKVQEKIMIYNYYFQNGELPPGNKIFR